MIRSGLDVPPVTFSVAGLIRDSSYFHEAAALPQGDKRRRRSFHALRERIPANRNLPRAAVRTARRRECNGSTTANRKSSAHPTQDLAPVLEARPRDGYLVENRCFALMRHWKSEVREVQEASWTFDPLVAQKLEVGNDHVSYLESGGRKSPGTPDLNGEARGHVAKSHGRLHGCIDFSDACGDKVWSETRTLTLETLAQGAYLFFDRRDEDDLGEGSGAFRFQRSDQELLSG